ncbi:MAG: class II fructose-bisphosphatase [Anaerolineales bacterium]
MKERLPANLAFDLARTTEAAALAAGRWIGLGERALADKQATEKMVAALNRIKFEGRIVIGESTVSKIPFYKHGEKVGTGDGPRLDLLIDAIDGSAQLSKGSAGAISAAAVAPAGSMAELINVSYMRKIVVDSDVAPYMVSQCLDAPPAWTLALVARAKKRKVSTLTVFVLDRPRHKDITEEIRSAGAHVMLAPDGDIAGGLLAAFHDTGVDLLLGTGGVVEGIMVACAVKATGGMLIAQLDPHTDQEIKNVRAAGFDPGQVYTHNDLVKSDQIYFAATGINDGPILSGVKYKGGLAKTHSILLRGETRTRREMIAEHLLDENRAEDQPD